MGRESQSMAVHQAFLPGAGLGTRLRPLTDRLPKPLIPVFHRPLIEWAMLACMAAGARRIAINTHHLPERWTLAEGGLRMADWQRADVAGGNGLAAQTGDWQDVPLHLFHEPLLLETGGGLKNIEGWLEDGPLLIHNGDIFTTMPLEKLVEAHERSGLPVTLALRSTGPSPHIALDESGTRVVDIRKMLGRAEGTHLFTGIYCVNREFLAMLPAGEKISVIPAFLELAKQGKLGAVVLDEGEWLDLGERESYLRAHREHQLADAVHPDAIVHAGAVLENSVVGPGAEIHAGAVLKGCVVWPGCEVLGDAVLENCIVFSDVPASGAHVGEDL